MGEWNAVGVQEGIGGLVPSVRGLAPRRWGHHGLPAAVGRPHREVTTATLNDFGVQRRWR